MSDSGPETPKPDQTVGPSELDKDLDNLRVQNEALRADNERLQKELAKAAEDYQTQVIISQQFNKQAEDARSQQATVQETIGMIENELETVKEQLAERDAGLAAVVADRDEVRSQLATVQAENEALNRELKEAQSQVKQVRQEYIRWRQKLSKVKEELGIGDRQPTTMRPERDELRSQLAELQKNPAPVIDLPEPADLLNQLKARRKKSRADLADVEVILEIIADGKGLPEPADLLNQLKGRRKKSKAELADVQAMLEILEENL